MEESLFNADEAYFKGGVKNPAKQPLPARMRPRSLDEYVGQSHLLAPGKLLRRAIDACHIEPFAISHDDTITNGIYQMSDLASGI